MNKILISLMIVLIAFSSMGELYRTTVDTDYGFYKVRNLDHQNATVLFENKTLTINAGDTVEWMSQTNPDEKITIVSDEGLWGNTSAILPWSFKKYNHTFNDVGIYNVHLKQYSRFHQQIVVVNVEKPTYNGFNGDGAYTTALQNDTILNNSILSTWQNNSDYNNIILNDTWQKLNTSQVNPQVTVKSSGFEFIIGFIALILIAYRKRR